MNYDRSSSLLKKSVVQVACILPFQDMYSVVNTNYVWYVQIIFCKKLYRLDSHRPYID